MTQINEPITPTSSPETHQYDSRSGCLGLSMLLLACVVIAAVLCVAFGSWK